MSRLRERYQDTAVPTLTKEFGYTSVMAVPKLERVVVNMGLGEATQNVKVIDAGAGDLVRITGQKPLTTRAKKSIAQFKVRKGMPIGSMVTLRRDRMYEFLDRLINVALPRLRDFQGVLRSSVDGQGNYSVGLREQSLFPEIDYGQIDRIRGLQITIVTSAKADQEGLRLLELLGMPFARDGDRR